MRIKHQWVDTRTGEIVKDSFHEFTDPLNDEGYRFPSHKAGARLFDDITFPHAMTPAEIGRMTLLSKVMIGATNMLGYRRGKNIYPYSAAEVAELARLQARRGKAFIQKMLNLRVMQRINTNSGAQYYINPAYFMAAGHRLSLDLFLLFRDELRQIVPTWVTNYFLSQAKTKRESENPLSLESAIDIIANQSRLANPPHKEMI